MNRTSTSRINICLNVLLLYLCLSVHISSTIKNILATKLDFGFDCAAGTAFSACAFLNRFEYFSNIECFIFDKSYRGRLFISSFCFKNILSERMVAFSITLKTETLSSTRWQYLAPIFLVIFTAYVIQKFWILWRIHFFDEGSLTNITFMLLPENIYG